MSAPAAPDPVAVHAEACRKLARLPGILGAMLGGLDHALWRARPAPREWSPVEIVCHLRDEEVEDFGVRVRVILDGGDAFARIDPEGWAVERRYRGRAGGGAGGAPGAAGGQPGPPRGRRGGAPRAGH